MDIPVDTIRIPAAWILQLTNSLKTIKMGETAEWHFYSPGGNHLQVKLSQVKSQEGVDKFVYRDVLDFIYNPGD